MFYKEITVATDRDNEDHSGVRLFAHGTTVSAAEQVEGFASPALPAPRANPPEPIERAEAFVAATDANVVQGGSRACYVPSTHNIHVPCIDLFRDAEAYASTNLLTTGAAVRAMQSPTRQAIW